MDAKKLDLVNADCTMQAINDCELRFWVEAGNSPFSNLEQVIHEDGTTVHGSLEETRNLHCLKYAVEMNIMGRR